MHLGRTDEAIASFQEKALDSIPIKIITSPIILPLLIFKRTRYQMQLPLVQESARILAKSTGEWNKVKRTLWKPWVANKAIRSKYSIPWRVLIDKTFQVKQIQLPEWKPRDLRPSDLASTDITGDAHAAVLWRPWFRHNRALCKPYLRGLKNGFRLT